MQKNKERGVLYGTAVLLLISCFVACTVALVNAITAPAIEANTAESIRNGIDLLFDGNGGFDDITADCRANGLFSEAEAVQSVYRVKSGTGGEDSYCVLSRTAGYGDDIELLVGFSCDGLIVGVRVIEASGETPGIGQRVTEEAFLAQFGGLEYNAEGTKIDGVSGATVSSTAVVKAVNAACTVVGAILEAEQGA